MIASPAAEAALLGCLLQMQSPLVLRGFLAQVEDADFTDPRHVAVLTAMRQLVASGQPVDAITVEGQLRRSGVEAPMTADKRAAVFLIDLLAAPPSVGSVGHYLLVILEHAVRRSIETAGVRLQQVAGASSLDDAKDVTRTDCQELARQFGRLAARESAEAGDAA